MHILLNMKKIVRFHLMVFLPFACLMNVFNGECQTFESVRFSPVKSIDWTAFDYQDVKIIELKLNTHNILVLSESDHGDGSSYDAQCMILKALIDSSRISAIYTES